MPEGDTIWRTAAALRPRIVGEVVRSAEPAALHRLTGRQVTAVEPVGKHLLIRFDGDLVLHSHMRMTGAWHIYPTGRRWQKPARFAKAVLRFDSLEAVLFSAPTVELLRDESTRVGHLGPDILADDFDAEEVLRRARSSRRQELGDVLLDQAVCAGIGNIYKCESMWMHRLDPWCRVADMPDADLASVYGTARRLMLAATAARGGQRRAVHSRGGRSCPRCGTPISVRAQGEMGRLTYFCARCQAPASRQPPDSAQPLSQEAAR